MQIKKEYFKYYWHPNRDYIYKESKGQHTVYRDSRNQQYQKMSNLSNKDLNQMSTLQRSSFFIQVARGLHDLHKKNCTYGNLNLSNIYRRKMHFQQKLLADDTASKTQESEAKVYKNSYIYCLGLCDENHNQKQLYKFHQSFLIAKGQHKKQFYLGIKNNLQMLKILILNIMYEKDAKFQDLKKSDFHIDQRQYYLEQQIFELIQNQVLDEHFLGNPQQQSEEYKKKLNTLFPIDTLDYIEQLFQEIHYKCKRDQVVKIMKSSAKGPQKGFQKKIKQAKNYQDELIDQEEIQKYIQRTNQVLILMRVQNQFTKSFERSMRKVLQNKPLVKNTK